MRETQQRKDAKCIFCIKKQRSVMQKRIQAFLRLKTRDAE